MNDDSVVIGLTGPNAAGKGEVCKYLSKKSFIVFSLSDVLREVAYKKGIEITRENLIYLGNKLRTQYGSGYLAKKLIEKIKKYNKVVIDSIRNIGEIKEFKREFKDKFFLIYITAPKKTRFKFLKKRGREGDPKTYKEFLAVEKRECSNKKNQQQIHLCKKHADFFINNNSSLDMLYKKVDTILSKIFRSVLQK
jgi:dephospho-CoA kinase